MEDMEVDMVADMVAKIPIEDFTDCWYFLEMMLEVVLADMEVDKDAEMDLKWI